MRNLASIFTFCMIIQFISCDKIDNPIDNRPINLDCALNSNTTLTNQNPDGVDYIVDCLLEFSDGTLSIEPGTKIAFEEGAGLEINRDGILNANGVGGNPVIFTSSNGNSPSWRGIFINSSKGRNVMDYVEIHNAGDGATYSLFENVTAAVTVQGRCSMTNCLISNSGGAGIFSEESLEDAKIDEFSDNMIENCSSYPIHVNMNLALNMDLRSCDFVDNGEQFIAFHNFKTDRLEDDYTMERVGLPYFIEEGLDLHAGLTIEAGVELAMGQGSYINITSDQNPFLTIQGSQSNHVTIRGRESISQYWDGIYIQGASAKNIFEYTDISDGGSENLGFTSEPANIALEFGGKLTLTNCTSARTGGSCDVIVSDFGGVSTLNNDNPDLSICTE